MSNKLGAMRGQAYLGTNAVQPPDWTFAQIPPSTSDVNYSLGDLWLDLPNEQPYVLVSLAGTSTSRGPIATWITWGGGGAGTLVSLTGNTGGAVSPDGVGNIDFIGDGVTVSVAGNPGSHTLTISALGSAANEYDTDAGMAIPAAGILNVFGGTGGRDINTTGAGNTIHIELNNSITLGDLANLANTDAITCTTGNISLAAGRVNLPSTNTAVTQGSVHINSNRFMHAAGGGTNTFLGTNSGNTNLTGPSNNTCIGSQSGFGLSNTGPATNNTAVGFSSLSGNTSAGATQGIDNTCIGSLSGPFITLGNNNTGLGFATLATITTGSNNIHIGDLTGTSAGTADNSNIYISNVGANESNTIRIGTTGGGASEQNNCFIAGTFGVNVGSVATVVSVVSSGHIGSTTIQGGSGITVTPGANTITISGSGTVIFTYTNVTTTPYVVLTTDEYLSVDTTSLAITIQLPNSAPSVGTTYIIKDRIGNAASNNITVTTVGGAVNIDGSTTFVMNTAFESINVIWNGTSYEIY